MWPYGCSCLFPSPTPERGCPGALGVRLILTVHFLYIYLTAGQMELFVLKLDLEIITFRALFSAPSQNFALGFFVSFCELECLFELVYRVVCFEHRNIV